MEKWKSFAISALLLILAAWMYYSGGNIIYAPCDGCSPDPLTEGWLYQKCSIPVAFLGLIILAYTLGKTNQKMSIIANHNSKHMLDSVHIMQEDSPSQNVGFVLIFLSSIAAILCLIFVILLIPLAVLGSTIGGSGCNSSQCTLLITLIRTSCYVCKFFYKITNIVCCRY